MKIRKEIYSGVGGYWSSTERHLAPNDTLTEDSTNWVVVPIGKRIRKRYGNRQSVTAMLTTPISVVSGLPGSTTFRARRSVSELRNRNLGYISEILTSGTNPVPIVMVSDDHPEAGTGRSFGTIWHGDGTYGPIVGAPVIASDINGPGFSTYNGTAELWPYIGGGRFVTNSDKWRFADGGRTFVETDRWLAPAKLYGIPGRWNKEWEGLGTLTERVMPNGKIPPAWALTKTEHGAGAGTWPNGGKFYYSVFYEDDDGTFGPLMAVRPPAAGTIHGTAGYGYYTLTGLCDYLDWSNIPIGPAGTRRRHLCRSLVVTSGLPDPETIGLVHTIDDNTTTTYRDFYGNDEAVAPFPEGVRQDYMWAPQHRYSWAFDQRFACGYVRPNKGAILIFPYHTDGAGSYLNRTVGEAMFVAGAQADDSFVGSCTYAFFVRKSGTDLVLYVWNGSYANPSTGHWSETLALTGLTLQDVVDHINARSQTSGWGTSSGPWTSAKVGGTVPAYPSATGYQFFAQLAPGCDPTASATELEDTTTYGDWGDSYQTGTGLPTYPNMRTYCPGLAAVLAMNSTWEARYQTRKNVTHFTGGGPGHAPYGISSWYVENERSLPNDYGDCVGGAPLLDGCIVLHTLGVGLMRNIKDGKTGLDEDYRLEPIHGIGGCIAPESIIHLNGAVGYLSRDGFIITDGDRSTNISLSVYDPSERRGAWSLEIALCATACQQDDDDATFTAEVIGTRLFVSYRHNDLNPTRRVMIYDFSASNAAAGIEQFLDNDGKPFGWSCPLDLDLAAIGSYRTSSGEIHVGVKHVGATNLELWKFEDPSALTDQGSVAVTAVGYFKTDNLGTDYKKSLREFRVRYKKTTTGMTVSYTRSMGAHSDPSLFADVLLDAMTAGLPYKRKRIPAKITHRSPSDIYEFKVTDTSGASTGEFFDIEAEFEVLASLY